MDKKEKDAQKKAERHQKDSAHWRGGGGVVGVREADSEKRKLHKLTHAHTHSMLAACCSKCGL